VVESITVVEQLRRRDWAVVAVLGALLGVVVAALVVVVAIPVVALTDVGVAGAVVAGVVAVVLGLVTAGAVVRVRKVSATDPPRTTFSAAGIERVVDGVSMLASWDQVVSVGVDRGSAVAGEVVVITTEPRAVLVPPTPHGVQRARLVENVHGGTVTISVAALPVPVEELLERAGTWSGR
jgi:hypothetical protein